MTARLRACGILVKVLLMILLGLPEDLCRAPCPLIFTDQWILLGIFEAINIQINV
jgi:hypothetical protein